MPKPNRDYVQRIFDRNKKSSYPIIKSNTIVQDAHINMPLSHQKVLDCMIMAIKPGQTDLTVRFSAYEFADMVGLKKTSNRLHYVMDVLQSIDRYNFWVKMPNGHYQICRWLKHVDVDPNGSTGYCTVQFEPYLRKYLFSKSKKYRTIYDFNEIMHMKNRYSPRLYEIFKSNMSRQPRWWLGITYDLNELRRGLNLMQRTKSSPYHVKRDKHGHIKYRYPRANDFIHDVIDPSLHEMTKLTRYNVGARIKRGAHNKILGLIVYMQPKNDRQLTARRDRIFFLTNHVPKNEQAHWRKVIINGKYSPLNKRNYAKSHHWVKQADGKYKIYSYASDKYVCVTFRQAKMIAKLNQSLAIDNHNRKRGLDDK